ANGTADTSPVRVGPPMVDYGTGAQAALAISAALYQRDRTGKGQIIDVSMLDSAYMLMAAHVVDTLVSGEAPAAHGNAHPHYSGYATYPTADGLLMIGAYTTEQMAAMMEVLGEADRANELRHTARADIKASRQADAERITARLATETAAEWETRFNAADVPAARVRDIAESIAEAQTRARTGLQAQPALAAAGGPDRLPIAGFAYAHGSPRVDLPPPRFGEHADAILGELGLSAPEINDLRQKRVI
ncbi:MAG: CoA transferase, partial [Pseudomonadota bacterium]